MQSRAFILFAIAALSVAFAAACGDGDDEITIEEYFQRITAAQDDLTESGKGVVIDGPFESEEDELKETHEFFDRVVPLLNDFRDRIDDIDPPSEVEDRHEAFLASWADLAEWHEMIATLQADVQSVAELDEVLDMFSTEGEAVLSRMSEICFELEEARVVASVAAGVDLDWQCLSFGGG